MAAPNSPDTPPYILCGIHSFLSTSAAFLRNSFSSSTTSHIFQMTRLRNGCHPSGLVSLRPGTVKSARDLQELKPLRQTPSSLTRTRRGRMSQCREGKPDLTALFLCLLGFLHNRRLPHISGADTWTSVPCTQSFNKTLTLSLGFPPSLRRGCVSVLVLSRREPGD